VLVGTAHVRTAGNLPICDLVMPRVYRD